MVNCAILSSNPWVGKWDCQIKSWRGKSWDEVLKSLSGNLWDEDPKSLNKKMDLNFKSLNRKIWHEDLKCFISFFLQKRGFIAAFTTQKSFHPNPMDNSWKTGKSIFFTHQKKNNGRNQIFSLEKKNHMWSNLIKNMYLIKFDQIIFGGGGEKKQ